VILSLSVYICTLKGKQLELLELSKPNLVDIYSMTVTQHELTLKVKGQGHMVMKCTAGQRGTAGR